MQRYRLEALAFTALLLAGAALFVSLQGNARAAANGQSVDPAAVNAVAAVQETFNYQGILRDTAGKLMTGPQNLTVKIYDTPTGGTALHTEIHDGVAVRDGLFNIVLGDQPGNSLSGVLLASPRFIAMTLAGEELLPRQRIHPVPLALLAENATTATTLVPNASVESVTLNGTTKLGTGTVTSDNNIAFDSKGLFVFTTDSLARLVVEDTVVKMRRNADIAERLTFDGAAPILIKKFSGLPDDKYDTGISTSTYHCVATSWSKLFDIKEDLTGYNEHWMYENYNNTGTWWIGFLTNDHFTVAKNWSDVVCFHKSMITVLPGVTQ